MSGDYLNNSIIEIGQNTEESPGDLGGLDVTQTPVVRKTRILRCKWISWSWPEDQ